MVKRLLKATDDPPRPHPRQRAYGVLLLVLFLSALSGGCGRSHLSACRWECNEIDFITLRAESRTSPDRLELVWHLAVRPDRLGDLWRLDHWLKLTVALSLPLAIREGEALDKSACLGLASFDVPELLQPSYPLAIFAESLDLRRAGKAIEAGGELALEIIPVGPPAPSVGEPLRIRLTLKETTFERVDTLTPWGAELLRDWPSACSGRVERKAQAPQVTSATPTLHPRPEDP